MNFVYGKCIYNKMLLLNFLWPSFAIKQSQQYVLLCWWKKSVPSHDLAWVDKGPGQRDFLQSGSSWVQSSFPVMWPHIWVFWWQLSGCYEPTCLKTFIVILSIAMKSQMSTLKCIIFQTNISSAIFRILCLLNGSQTGMLPQWRACRHIQMGCKMYLKTKSLL